MSKRKKKQSQTKEIIWNIINSFLSGALVLLGAFANGGVGKQAIFIAFITAGVVAISQFKDYWASEKKEYQTKIFMFVH